MSELLRLADALGVRRLPDLVCPQGGSAAGVAPATPYAVLHPNPMYHYKRWNDAGWRALARGLAARGLAVVVTQGRDAEEGAYVDRLFAGEAVVRERGRLDWAGLTALLKGAVVYVGPDTSVTHLAAGSGCPTVALYGPTSPRLVGPWPVGGLDQPWAPAGRMQRRGNVWLVQNPLPCLPCEQLGCDRHLDSRSQCLDELAADQVLAAVDQAVQVRRQCSKSLQAHVLDGEPASTSPNLRWRVPPKPAKEGPGNSMIRFSDFTPRMWLILAHDLLVTAVAVVAAFYLRFGE